MARASGLQPRVALLSFATFGNPPVTKAARIRDAVAELDSREVDFEYDGEMSADVALDPELMRALSVLPPHRPGQRADHAGACTPPTSRASCCQQLGGGTVIGPLLMGLPGRCRSCR